jgi:hypothetical protein
MVSVGDIQKDLPGWPCEVVEADPHKALKMYRSFMDETAELRESVEESTSAVDQYVEGQIEWMREEGALARERKS